MRAAQKSGTCAARVCLLKFITSEFLGFHVRRPSVSRTAAPCSGNRREPELTRPDAETSHGRPVSHTSARGRLVKRGESESGESKRGNQRRLVLQQLYESVHGVEGQFQASRSVFTTVFFPRKKWKASMVSCDSSCPGKPVHVSYLYGHSTEVPTLPWAGKLGAVDCPQ